MASKIIPAVLAFVCLQASVAVKDPECLTSCLSQQVGCSSSCENFIFGPEICQSICSSWGIRCQTNCPEVTTPATIPSNTFNLLARINCLSVYSNGQFLRCPLPQATPEMILRLFLSRKLSMFDCTQGVNYGLAPDNSYIWTSGGCSAEFSVIRIDVGSSSSPQHQPPLFQQQQPRPILPLPQQTAKYPWWRLRPQSPEQTRPVPTTHPTQQLPITTSQPLPTQTQQSVTTTQPLSTQTQQTISTSQPLPTQTQQPDTTSQPLPTQTQQPDTTSQPLPTQTQQPDTTSQPLPTQTQQPISTSQPLPTQTQRPITTSQPLPTQTQQPVATTQPLSSQPTSRYAWTEWGACSVTCNQGRQFRSKLQICPEGDTECIKEKRIYELRTCISGECGVQDEPAQPKPQPTSSETPEQGSVQGSATFVNRATCGRANFNRIVNGTVAGRCEYPWMVLIYHQVNHKICGGSIIGDREILTASHCLFSLDESTYQYEEARASHLIVFSGSSTMPLQGTFPERGLKRNYVAQVITYPEYSPSSARNDIAILKLRRNLPKDECHRQVCLLSRREARQRTRGCRTMGWGKTTNRADGEATSRMRWTSVTIESQERCRNIYGSRTANNATLCAGGPSSDSCSGDSGGPLVCRGDNGAFYQYGIVSLGLEGQCGRLPGLYTRVTNFMSWVAAQAA